MSSNTDNISDDWVEIAPLGSREQPGLIPRVRSPTRVKSPTRGRSPTRGSSPTRGKSPTRGRSPTPGVIAAPEAPATAIEDPWSIVRVTSADPVYGESDYQRLVAIYGNELVMMPYITANITTFIVSAAIIKMGILSRYVKAVNKWEIKKYLSEDVMAKFTTMNIILVCAPPLDEQSARILATAVHSEEQYFETKLITLTALNDAQELDDIRLNGVVTEMKRYLASVTAIHNNRVSAVVPPTGEWEIYAKGSEVAVDEDKLARTTKAYAAGAITVVPPLPRASAAETRAVIKIHDFLTARLGFDDMYNSFIIAVLQCPMFTHLCHDAEFLSTRQYIADVWHMYGSNMCKYLLSEEFTHAGKRLGNVSPKDSFILTLSEVIAMGVPHAPSSVEYAQARLNIFMGGYLGELDLSRTFITGSAISASLIRTLVECRYQMPPLYDGYRRYIAAHYPATRTIPRDRAAYLKVAAMILNYTADVDVVYRTETSATGVVLTITAIRVLDCSGNTKSVSAVLDVKGGADIDMAISVDSNAEFDTVANQHWEVVRRHYPAATLRKVFREDPEDTRYNWAIEAIGNPDFRPIEMYRSGFDHIVTHHVGMVSGAYTGFWGKPQFFVSARLVHSMAELESPNYYYFASRKVNPQYVIAKYYLRGFKLHRFPPGIQAAIHAQMKADPAWDNEWHDTNDDDGNESRNLHWKDARDWPALAAKGAFSAYSLLAEIEAFYDTAAGYEYGVKFCS